MPDALTPLGLLGDLEVTVEICFGSRTVALEELSQLTAGSVVILDQRIDEPVELLVEGRPYARGNVVLLDGHYGFELTSLLEPRV